MSNNAEQKIVEYAHGQAASPERRQWQRVDTLGLLAYVGTLLVITVALVGFLDPQLLALALALPIASFARRFVRKRETNGGPDPDARFEASFRLVTWAFTLIVLTGAFRVYRCPHGHAYGIGPIGLAYRSVAPVEHPYQQVSSAHLVGLWHVWVRH